MSADLSSSKSECVKVVIRCRPLSGQEIQDGRQKVVDLDVKSSSVTCRKPNDATAVKSFTFDAVYDHNSTQVAIYEETASIIVDSTLDGYNGTVFAYGQTGTGKTFTMVGVLEQEELLGMIPRAFEHIFRHIQTTGENSQFLVRASYLEIYNEEIRDLLSKNPKTKLELKDNPDTGVYVKDLSAFVVKGVEEMHQVMAAGTRNRSVGQTKMNETSSRSHSIFTITIECSTNGHIRVGKLNMVDLAGSERQSKTGATGDTLKEATKINLSLSALGNVISALVDAKTSFVPYRDSKLTRLLQDSLGGNTKTVMVANVGPVDYNYDETISTLRYAHRAKSIQNKPKINEDPKDAMLREFQEEIARLRRQVELQQAGHQVVIDPETGEEKVITEKIIEKVVEVEKDMGGASQSDAKMLLQMEQELEQERLRIEQEKGQTEAEKEQLLKELMEKEKLAEDQRKQQAEMIQKVKQMEEKILAGSSVMEKAAQQELELQKAQRAVAEMKRNEKKLAKLAEKNIDEKLMLQEKSNSVEEQVQKLTTKLEKLWERYQLAQQEIKDLQHEFQLEREDLLETIRAAAKEVKLKTLLMDEFVPNNMKSLVEKYSHWNEEEGIWTIEKIHLAGNNLLAPGAAQGAGGFGSGAGGSNPPGSGSGEQTRYDRACMRQNVYFVYDSREGMLRSNKMISTASVKQTNLVSARKSKSQSARPNTASRKGRGAGVMGSTAASGGFSGANGNATMSTTAGGGGGNTPVDGFGGFGGGGEFMGQQDLERESKSSRSRRGSTDSSASFPKARGLVQRG
ncbi:unnamed protein product [Amoebophrya sp. A120]|nr:unnamed protein product [Amoebophrya sp. A120]|eukprot:GSA120T00015807001.1